MPLKWTETHLLPFSLEIMVAHAQAAFLTLMVSAPWRFYGPGAPLWIHSFDMKSLSVPCSNWKKKKERQIILCVCDLIKVLFRTSVFCQWTSRVCTGANRIENTTFTSMISVSLRNLWKMQNLTLSLPSSHRIRICILIRCPQGLPAD